MKWHTASTTEIAATIQCSFFLIEEWLTLTDFTLCVFAPLLFFKTDGCFKRRGAESAEFRRDWELYLISILNGKLKILFRSSSIKWHAASTTEIAATMQCSFFLIEKRLASTDFTLCVFAPLRFFKTDGCFKRRERRDTQRLGVVLFGFTNNNQSQTDPENVGK